jgi:SlyX protein
MSQPTDDRLTNLEIKASFAEDYLDKLDQIITDQQAQIDRLCKDVQRLNQSLADASMTAHHRLDNEQPPHY